VTSPMFVRFCMTLHLVTVTPQDTLATAQRKMMAGRFRRLPVVQDDTLVGVLTDRDIRCTWEGKAGHRSQQL